MVCVCVMGGMWCAVRVVSSGGPPDKRFCHL